MGRKRELDFSNFENDPDPEIREAWLEVLRQRESGEMRSPPRRAADVRSLEDLCLYIFKLAHLDGSYQMLKTNGRVERWVWFGHDFTDRLVMVVERIAPQIPNKDELKEIRLVATKISIKGVERLRRVFPKARLKVYTDEEDHGNWQLSQAAYSPETGEHPCS